MSELRAGAEAASRKNEDEGQAERLEGADESGSILVTVDARGQAVDVGVARDWRERLELGRFAGALFEAYAAAVKASLERAALTALAAEPDAGVTQSAASGPAVPPGLEEEDWLRAVWATLDANDAATRRLSAMDSPDHQERTLPSPRGYLTLHLRGHGLERITGDLRRIATADAMQLQQDALAALQAIALAGDHSTDSGSPDAA